MKISKNFSLAELITSPTALRYGFKEQYNPSQEVIDNLTIACEEVLEKIRKEFGCTIVTSGFRCHRLNHIVGGSTNSHHLKGMAFDINFGAKNKVLYDFIKDNLAFTQLIWEYGTDENPDWVHVAYDKNALIKNIKRIN